MGRGEDGIPHRLQKDLGPKIPSIGSSRKEGTEELGSTCKQGSPLQGAREGSSVV